MILNRAKEYYKNDKERLRKKARDKYRNLSEEDKNKGIEYGKNRYHNMSEEKKQKLKEYQKEYREKQEIRVICLKKTTIVCLNLKKIRIVFLKRILTII